MKLPVFALLCLCSVSVVSAQPPPGPEPSAEVGGHEGPTADTPAPWSVVGTWNGVHQHWAKPVTISADGRFFVDHGDHRDYGNWKLATEADHINLVLGWDGWDPETVTLVGPDEFRGKVPTGQMILRRHPPGTSPGAASEQSHVPPGPNSSPAPAASLDASPCGSWIWQHDATTNVINADGTTGHGGDQGTWHWIDQANRKLQIDWKSGFVDTATVAPDGKTMNVVNNADDTFTVRRATPP